MKKILLMAMLMLLNVGLWARPVSESEARALASQFWRSMPDADKKNDEMNVKHVGLDHLYFFVHSSGHGFVVVAADDCAEPVLAYSATSPVGDTLNSEVRWWLEGINMQVGCAAREGRPSNPGFFEAQWSSGEAPVLTTGEPAAVLPLIATRWDQGEYYNDSCPLSGGRRCLTGCVATATAQLMKYWNHPYRGTNSNVSFTDVNLNTAYDWVNMPVELTSASSDAEKAAVAQLMFHVGRAVNMSYGTSWSSAYNHTSNSARMCSERALFQFFGYSRRLVSLSRGHYSDAQWIEIIKSEVAAGRPLLYGGNGFSGGHAFLCDGYDAQDRLHFNWGWSGYCDGYFASNALTPGAGGSGSNSESNYTMNQDILVGVYPEWTVGLPFSEDFTASRRYWSGSLAAGDTLFGPLLALPAAEATLTWQAAGSATYSICLDGTPVYTGSDATGSVSLLAHASTNPQISICVASGSLIMQSLNVSTVSSPTYTLRKVHGGTGGNSSTQSPSRAFDEYATLTAYPASGYHFSHWDDGSPWNPRYVYASGDRTYTAYFEPNRVGDTLRLDNGAYSGYYIRSSDALSIGGTQFRNNSQLTAVMYYPIDSGSYTISIPDPMNTSSVLFEKTVYPAYPGMWNTCYLNSELRLDSTRYYHIYIRSNHTGRSPLMASFCGNSSGNNVGLRCIFNGLFNPRQLTVVNGSGSGLFLRDTTVVITADQGGGNRFLAWNDGNTDNPRTVRVVSDTTFIAFYSEPSKIYVRFVSSDTALGRVRGAEGWYDYNVQRHIEVEATVISPKARFSHWSDISNEDVGEAFTPSPMHRYYTLDSAYVWNHDSVTVTAYFVPVAHGDTLIYDDGGETYGGTRAAFTGNCTMANSLTHTTWGVRYDPTMLERRTQIIAVQSYTTMYYLYDTVRVYQGGDNAPGTLLREQVFRHVQGTYAWEWKTFTFTTPVTIDPTQPVWVTISAKDDGLNEYDRQQMMGVGCYTGNPGGNWFYQPGTGWSQFSLVYDYGANVCHRRFSAPSEANAYPGGTWALRAIMPVMYTVAATSANAAQGTVTGGGQYGEGRTAVLRATANTGFRFLQWQDGNRQNPRSVVVVQDTQFVASFEAIPQFTLTVMANDPAMGTVTGSGTYYEGSSATLTATPATGHRFVQWNDGNTQTTRTVTVTANATYTATFEAIPTYTLTVVANDPAMGTVTGGGTYQENSQATLTATPAAGHRFVQWNDGNTQTTRTVTVTANATYTATFEAIPTYTLTVVANDPAMGTVTGSGTYQENSQATLTATPAAGHRFVQWNDGNTQTTRTVAVTANATYTATFEAIPTYTLTVVANDPAMGTVTGSGTYQENSQATLTATPATGHRFVRWQDDNTQATRTVTVTADATYTAYFEVVGNEGIEEVEGYTLTLFPNPATTTLTVQLPWSGEAMELTLLAADGRIVATYRVSGEQFTLDTGLLPRGVYLLRLCADGKQAIGKVELR